MAETPNPIELHVLSGTSLTAPGGVELHSVLAQPKRYARLVYLALAAPERMQRRDSLLALFWPESDEEHARGALRTSLHFLRRSLGEAVIETRGTDEVGLAAGTIWCDALAFRAAVQTGRWEEAAKLYRGELLPGFALEGAADWEEWLSAERASLARAAAGAFEALASAREAAGDFAGAIECWRRLATSEPFQRRIALGLMRALVRSGDSAGALEHARLFQQRLHQEFEAGEDPEVAALAEQLRSGLLSVSPAPESAAEIPAGSLAAPAAPAVMAATASSEPPQARFGLPVPPTRPIGRDDQLTSVLGTLMQESVALLTLTGPGGIGKTRLALAVARAHRFTMLETIHEFARERLEQSGAASAVRRRHAEFFQCFAEQTEPRTRGAEQAYWLRRLEEEHDNLRTALRWMLDHAEAESALRTAAALAPFWYLRSYIREGGQWLREALDTSPPNLLELRARALYGAGRIASKQDVAAARALTEESLAICRILGSPIHTGRALNLLAAIVMEQGEVELPETLLEESVRLQREAGNLTGETVAIGNLGMLAWQRENYARAAELYQRGLELSRQVGESSIIADMLGNLGETLLRIGELDRAAALTRESLFVHREVGNRVGIGLKLVGMASIATAEREAMRAARLFGAAEALFTRLGTHVQVNGREPYNRDVAAARAQLDELAWRRAWAEGEAMSLDDAIDYALQE